MRIWDVWMYCCWVSILFGVFVVFFIQTLVGFPSPLPRLMCPLSSFLNKLVAFSKKKKNKEASKFTQRRHKKCGSTSSRKHRILLNTTELIINSENDNNNHHKTKKKTLLKFDKWSLPTENEPQPSQAHVRYPWHEKPYGKLGSYQCSLPLLHARLCKRKTFWILIIKKSTVGKKSEEWGPTLSLIKTKQYLAICDILSYHIVL